MLQSSYWVLKMSNFSLNILSPDKKIFLVKHAIVIDLLIKKSIWGLWPHSMNTQFFLKVYSIKQNKYFNSWNIQ